MVMRYFGRIRKYASSGAIRHKSLKNRLAWRISAIVVASLMLVTSIVISLMVRYIENIQKEMEQEISFQKLRRVEQRIDYLIEMVDRLAENPLLANGLIDTQGRQNYLPKLIDNFKANQGIVGVSLVDFDGASVFSVNELPPRFNEFPALRQALAMRHHSVILSPLKNHIIIVVPIEYYNTTQGAIIVAYDLISIAKRIFSESDGYFERLVENDSQRIVYSQMDEEEIEDYVITPAYPDKTTPYLLNLNFRLDVGVFESKHYTAIHQIIFKFILLSLLATVTVTLVAVRIGNGIARPILGLCRRIMQSGADDRVAVCSPVGTNDELEELANAFDRRTAELWEIRDHLEQKVFERTRELQLAHEELAGALNVANAATKAKSDFLANMSHEIRTPMNAIIGLTGICLKTDLSAKQRDYLNKIISSAESLLGIINDILDFSKIEAGKLNIEHVPFNLDGVLDNLSTLLSVKAQEKSIELLFFRSLDIPSKLIGDPLRLGQVLTNLTSNAIKFTPSGEGEVVVSVKMNAHSADQIRLEFSICDTGIGITPDQRRYLFKPFSQTDSSITRNYGGTGLGLVISKQLVELMGGKIWFNSIPEIGSTFMFDILMELPEQAIQKKCEMNMNLDNLRVMVVDDNEISIEIMKTYLESFSVDVTVCRSGEEVIDRLRKDKGAFDLIMMDWKMPGMNGLETAISIKKDIQLQSPPKIILVTHLPIEDIYHIHGVEYLDNILNKPVNPSLLFNAISETCTGKSLQSVRIRQNDQFDMTTLRQIQGARILLVEDNEINQQVAHELLQQINVVVDIANNGRMAIQMLDQNRYDCVLMDIQMPIMDGLEATRRIRDDGRFANLPIIAMTANAMVEDRKRTHDVGMNDHIVKPVDSQKLFNALLRWIPPGERNAPVVVPDINCNVDASLPEMPGINTNEGLSRMSGNVHAYYRLLMKFANNHENTVTEIRQAVDYGDHALAVRLAHTLKGVAGTIGAIPLHQAARDLEMALINADIDLIDGLMISTDDELERVVAIIRATRQTERTMVCGSISMENIVPRLKNLRDILTRYDSEAEDVLSKIIEEVSDPALLASLQALNVQIARYDFDNALAGLDILIENHMPHLA
ncbi:two-component system, sensor histidine kinase and response regulator [Gammaproteobacteria bacterium]